MEDCGKVEESVENTVEKGEEQPVEESEHAKDEEEKPVEEVVVVAEASAAEPEQEQAISEVPEAADEQKPKETEIQQTKPEGEVPAALEKKETEEESIQTIEECDTGGDEIPEVFECPAAEEQVPTVVVASSQESEKEPVVLAELTSVPPPQEELPVELNLQNVSNVSLADIVAIDDDDDDGAEDEEDDDDGDDEDEEDDDDDGISNEALNDDDEEDQDISDDEARPEKNTSSSRNLLPPHPIDDFDDEYDDMDDDEDMEDIKDDSSAPVVIGSSDDEAEIVQKQPVQVKKPTLQKFDMDGLDYDDDEIEDDDDDYDDDDLMNAVVTSAAKGLSSSASSSPVKKERQLESPGRVRKREQDQITALTRRINYGKIAKKKSLNWLYSKKKREAYKSILPSRRPSTQTMRSEQSGGLLHLKISQPSVTSIAQKPSIHLPSASTPIITRIEPRAPVTTTPQKSVKDEYVIDLDSSPEKDKDKQTPPRNQSDDQRNSDTDVKKPPDSKAEEDEAENSSSNTMQQTDKVRDSIQKSTEQVEDEKSVSRLSCEQNKENLQSNEALKKENDEVPSKLEAEPKGGTGPSEEPMDTTEESTLKPYKFTISSVSSAEANKFEEYKDQTKTTSPPTEEEITASKVKVEDVPEKETPRGTASPQPTGTVTATASKRRRSSSTVQDTNKTLKPTSGTTATTDQDDDEEYIHPTKKLREELQSNYPAHDRILNEYIEKTSNDSIDTIQRHIEQTLSEIQTLNDMIKAKEVEWNNMLHLKKVKEEICFRLTRRKQCMEIMTTKVGEAGHSAGLDEDYLSNETAMALGGKTTPPSQKNPQLSSTPIAAAISSLSSNICNFTAVSSSSSAAPTTAQLIVQNRANMKSSDLIKEKANTQRLHRNILPKPTTTSPTGSSANNQQQQQSPPINGSSATSSSNQPILNSYLTSADSVQQLVDMMNGHHNNHGGGLQNGGSTGGANSQAAMVGRQGPFKDVRSIIADFRQQHPEVVPRRGRRVKNSNNSNLSDSNTILGNALKSDTNSRPSSNDSSSHSLSNINQSSTSQNNVNSFKDVLAPFSKSQGAASLRSAGGLQQNPPYPEVTLHPVTTPLNASGGQDQPTGSLLHGILTKFSRPNESTNSKTVANQTSASCISNFSPTLARLLTAPERISAGNPCSSGNQTHHSSAGGGDGNGSSGGNTHHSIPGFGVNLSKVVAHNSEITITPVMNSMHQQQSMLQQQYQQQQIKEVLSRAAAAVSGNSVKDEHFLKLSSFASAPAGNDDDAEDSVDRLVIDEGVDSIVGGDEHQRIAPHAIGQEFNENEVPVCQGCKKHEAQFVCAGCGNQWYCSRECQVTAWDDHSEVCTG